MLRLQGYTIEEKLYAGAQTSIFRGKRQSDGRSVVIKTLAEPYEEVDRARLVAEYQFLAQIGPPACAQVVELINSGGAPHLVSLDHDGRPLSEVYSERRGEPSQVLSLMCAVCDALAQVHAQRVMHLRLNPDNILYDAVQNAAVLIDFGNARPFSGQAPVQELPEIKDLPFLAPEQCGRLSRTPDHRSDLYALGTVLYQLLSGRPPFISDDPMTLVHCHLAKQPEPLTTLLPDLPQPISDLVDKLLAKSPEERYQSVFGLHHDLKLINGALRGSGSIDVTLGARDVPAELTIPQRLYGREREEEILDAALSRANGGEVGVLLVAGKPGIGKSALIDHLKDRVIAEDGIFMNGKFEQIGRDIPCLPLRGAFRDLFEMIAGLAPSEQEKLTDKIHRNLDGKGQAVVDVIPDAARLVGQQPELPELPPTESRFRFQVVFRDLISALQWRDQPPVLFLDDWQWADNATVDLMKSLIASKLNGGFLLIGAYRDNEIGPSHPMRLHLEDLAQSADFSETLTLDPLHEGHVRQMLSDSLRRGHKDVAQLAHLCHGKTGGTPFFLRQFLLRLYRDKLLSFDQSEGRWSWNPQEIEAAGITDNVVELMVNNLKRLPSDTLNVLKTASVVGSQFELTTLAIAHDQPKQKVAALLWPALESGVVLGQGEDAALSRYLTSGEARFRFLHDRVHQAAESLISTEERPRFHVRIGRHLKAQFDKDRDDTRLFETVQHLNRGIPRLEAHEQEALAELNTRAGRRARDSSAFQLAYTYLHTAAGLLPKDSWSSNYEDTLQLHLDEAYAALSAGNFDQMERALETCRAHAQSPLDRVRADQIKVKALMIDRQKEGVRLGLKLLRKLGVNIPDETTKLDVVKEYLRTRLALRGRRIDPNTLPQMTDPQKTLAMQVINDFSASAGFVQENLLPILGMRSLQLSLRYGVSPPAAYCWVFFAVVLCILDNLKEGFRFEEEGMAFLKHYGTPAARAIATGGAAMLIRPRREHLSKALPSLRSAYRQSMEVGQVELMGQYSTLIIAMELQLGQDLKSIAERSTDYQKTLRRYGIDHYLHCHGIFRQAIINLSEEVEDPCRLSGAAYDAEANHQHYLEHGHKLAFLYYNFFKMKLAYSFRRYKDALVYSEAMEPYLDPIKGSPLSFNFVTFDALVRLKLADGMAVQAHKQLLKPLKSHRKELRKWAHTCPANFEHRHLMVEAEWARLAGDTSAARHFYDQALESAGRHQYLFDRAMILESAGRFHHEEGEVFGSGARLRAAHEQYRNCGATACAQAMAVDFPQLFGAQQSNGTAAPLAQGQLDLGSITKAAAALSGEILLDDLLRKIMTILLENAGAGRVALFMKAGGRWVLEAEESIGEGQHYKRISQPMMESEHLCLSVVRLVINATQSVVVDDARRDARFAKDSAVIGGGIRSLCCLPLVKAGTLVAVLYLENNLVSGAFSTNHLEVLNALSLQLAVALENARLYADLDDNRKNLERMVEERTAALGLKNRELQRKNTSILDSLNYARRIQNSLLPDPEERRAILGQHFLLALPRDPVSGDFFWATRQENLTFVAVADCTGHGVPGALLSIMGISLLKRIIEEEMEEDPAQILESLHHQFRALLQQERVDNTRDGMDISLCRIAPKAGTLTFAGARQSIVVVDDRGKIDHYRGDRRPVGGRRKETLRRFRNQLVPIRFGQTVYMTSDGFADQQGQDGQKFGRRQLRELFAQMAHLKIDERRAHILAELKRHQGAIPQRDDITVLGFNAMLT